MTMERFERCHPLRSRNHGRHTRLCRHARPLQNLIDALEGGESVEDFLEGFPSVKRSQAIAVIEAGQLKMLETVGHAHSH